MNENELDDDFEAVEDINDKVDEDLDEKNEIDVNSKEKIEELNKEKDTEDILGEIDDINNELNVKNFLI